MLHKCCTLPSKHTMGYKLVHDKSFQPHGPIPTHDPAPPPLLGCPGLHGLKLPSGSFPIDQRQLLMSLYIPIQALELNCQSLHPDLSPVPALFRTAVPMTHRMLLPLVSKSMLMPMSESTLPLTSESTSASKPGLLQGALHWLFLTYYYYYILLRLLLWFFSLSSF